MFQQIIIVPLTTQIFMNNFKLSKFITFPVFGRIMHDLLNFQFRGSNFN